MHRSTATPCWWEKIAQHSTTMMKMLSMVVILPRPSFMPLTECCVFHPGATTFHRTQFSCCRFASETNSKVGHCTATELSMQKQLWLPFWKLPFLNRSYNHVVRRAFWAILSKLLDSLPLTNSGWHNILLLELNTLSRSIIQSPITSGRIDETHEKLYAKST